ncbi:hypothetical protein CJ010_22965 [Azoarcus sp. DD4]|uniref:DUF3592 domain-containing protein n=1 Tax=Azoarcus sp. DD4 TaxID=2027405 RepID=UPI00112BE49A|nr:DUF3592 domain-containing protein [Azoarcus sp. DD4]QDF99196.1 hypothetical protein CJ010_22965 [Azoarcus sp. DD4]
MRRVPLKQYLLEAVIRVALPLLGVVLLVAGLLGVVSFGVVPTLDAMRSRQWTPVVATLDWARIEPATVARSRPLPTLAVRYSYRYGGVDFVGRRNDLHFGLDTPSAVQARLRQVEDGRALTAWVNPAAPEQAMLDRSLHWGVLLLSIPAALVALIGGLLVFGGMVAWNDWRPLWRRQPEAVVVVPADEGDADELDTLK